VTLNPLCLQSPGETPSVRRVVRHLQPRGRIDKLDPLPCIHGDTLLFSEDDM
jgi:hypothetical protein